MPARPTARKAIIKGARAEYLAEAEQSYVHIPMMETFINFQLMTAARRSETMSLTWDLIDFASQSAFIPETKNGRPRKLPLRSDLIELLRQLPRTDDRVFPVSVDALRKAWARICEAAGLVAAEELHVHDLGHEAISRMADAGGKLPGGFSLVDLQAFSGHRDTRMLLRYTHLCTPSLAKRLDAAFADQTQITLHRGQRRLKRGASITIKAISNEVAAAGSVPVTATRVALPGWRVTVAATGKCAAQRPAPSTLSAGGWEQKMMAATPLNSPCWS